MLCVKFGLNYPSGSEEEVYMSVFNVFLLFCYHLPHLKGMAFQLNTLGFPLHKDTLCPGVRFEIGPVVLEKKISNFVYVFLLFYFYLPLIRAWPGSIFIKKNFLNFPSHNSALCQVWLTLV